MSRRRSDHDVPPNGPGMRSAAPVGPAADEQQAVLARRNAGATWSARTMALTRGAHLAVRASHRGGTWRMLVLAVLVVMAPLTSAGASRIVSRLESDLEKQILGGRFETTIVVGSMRLRGPHRSPTTDVVVTILGDPQGPRYWTSRSAAAGSELGERLRPSEISWSIERGATIEVVEVTIEDDDCDVEIRDPMAGLTGILRIPLEGRRTAPGSIGPVLAVLWKALRQATPSTSTPRAVAGAHRILDEESMLTSPVVDASTKEDLENELKRWREVLKPVRERIRDALEERGAASAIIQADLRRLSESVIRRSTIIAELARRDERVPREQRDLEGDQQLLANARFAGLVGSTGQSADREELRRRRLELHDAFTRAFDTPDEARAAIPLLDHLRRMRSSLAGAVDASSAAVRTELAALDDEIAWLSGLASAGH